MTTFLKSAIAITSTASLLKTRSDILGRDGYEERVAAIENELASRGELLDALAADKLPKPAQVFPPTRPLFCVLKSVGFSKDVVLIAYEGNSPLTIETSYGDEDQSPRRYEVRRQNGALTLIEVTE